MVCEIFDNDDRYFLIIIAKGIINQNLRYLTGIDSFALPQNG